MTMTVRGIIWNGYENVYDDNGNSIKGLFYGREGTLSSWIEKEYDVVGDLIKETRHEGDGEMYSWTECIYDEES